MTKKEAIEILRMYITNDCNDCDGISKIDCNSKCEGLKALDVVIEALEAKEKSDKLLDMCWDKILDDYPRWTPCSERLPKEHMEVLITWNFGRPNVAKASYERNGWNIDSRKDLPAELEIIAWMPLPKPYKEGEDDEV